jgi:hypothetical protein
MKKIVGIFIGGLLLAVIILFFLQLDIVFLNKILALFREKRGTLTYEGEDKGSENMTIFFGIITPFTLVCSFGIVFFISKYINREK